MTRTDYRQTEEWKRAEHALTVALGFRVARRELHVTTPYIWQEVEWNDDGEEVVTLQKPTEHWAWHVWSELVRARIDHGKACKLAWDLYCAATGTTIENFNGMPAGEPAKAIREERERLLRVADVTRPA